MSAHDTHTHTHTDNTHTHTHTRASARADLCVFRGLHAAVRRDSVGPEIVSNFSLRAQREGKHTLGNGRSGSAPRAEGVGACTTRSDRVEFGASRTHCNGRPRFLCRQRKSGVGTGVNGGERTQALCRLASLDLGALRLRCDATRARQNRAFQIGRVVFRD
jgi:hypothetical protein